MGEAKQRGTFEQRRVAGEIKRAEEERVRRVEYLKREAAITPQMRENRRRVAMILAMFH